MRRQIIPANGRQSPKFRYDITTVITTRILCFVYILPKPTITYVHILYTMYTHTIQPISHTRAHIVLIFSSVQYDTRGVVECLIFYSFMRLIRARVGLELSRLWRGRTRIYKKYIYCILYPYTIYVCRRVHDSRAKSITRVVR